MAELSSELVMRELLQDDPKQRQPYISRASELLDWAPKTQLADGLRQTIDYFRERIKKLV